MRAIGGISAGMPDLSMNALLFTVLAGVIVTVAGLLLEYYYFKPRREVVNSPNANLSTKWASAIQTAIQTLNKSYSADSLKVTRVRVYRGLIYKRAKLQVHVGDTDFLYVEIDQSGDVLEVDRWKGQSL